MDQELDDSRWLLVSDVDDTLLGDDEALLHLVHALKQAPATLITCYNSNRTCANLRQILARHKHLLMPDYLIGAAGTEIQCGATGRPLQDYTLYLQNRRWPRERIVELMKKMGFEPAPKDDQTFFRLSYRVADRSVYRQVMDSLLEADIRAKVTFSRNRNLNIVPIAAGKGNVIAYLRRRLNIDVNRVVVAGDSNRDLEMFVAPYRGIVVANADSHLKEQRGSNIYHARLPYAGGILEGLQHWSVPI